MARGHKIAMFLALSLLANAFCSPTSVTFRKHRSLDDNEVDTKDLSDADDDLKISNNENKDSVGDDSKLKTISEDDDDDDDFDDDKTQQTSSGGGSNIFSLLNLATALFPSSSGNNVKRNNEFVKKVIREAITKYQAQKIQKRQDIGDNVIDIDYAAELKPPVFERQESDESDDSEGSESNSEDSDEDNGAEESVEQVSNENGGSKSKQESASNASNGNSDASDSDYDEPEGDGQGGILGLLAGLSGDGESDLGSLLAAVGGIVANLSGDGVDINAIIATGLGLFVGLLSDENTNPGEVIASYLLTSLDTITGGGAQNNGAFFGKFLSSLVKGVSAADGDSGSGSEENGGMKMADSAGFFLSLIMGLLGEMSKHSSGSSSWR